VDIQVKKRMKKKFFLPKLKKVGQMRATMLTREINHALKNTYNINKERKNLLFDSTSSQWTKRRRDEYIHAVGKLNK